MATDHIRCRCAGARRAARGAAPRAGRCCRARTARGDIISSLPSCPPPRASNCRRGCSRNTRKKRRSFSSTSSGDLVVTEDRFEEVGLSFGGIPERLVVPFSSIKSFRPFGAVRPAIRALRYGARGTGNQPADRPCPLGVDRSGAFRRKSGRGRPSRAKAPKSCSWTASARNRRARHPRAIGWTHRRATCSSRLPVACATDMIDGSTDRILAATPATRTETDGFGPIQVPADRYWGAQTERSRQKHSASAMTGCRLRNPFMPSAWSSLRLPKPTASLSLLDQRRAAPSSAPRAGDQRTASTISFRWWCGRPVPAPNRT